MIKPNKKIEPLREDLNELIPDQFYTTTTYKRWLVANNLQDVWGQCLDYAERHQSVILMGDFDISAAGDAMTLLLNNYYEKNLNFITKFIIQLLKLYVEEAKQQLNVTNLRQDFIIIGAKEEDLVELDELSIKVIEVSSTDETLTDEE